MEASWGEEHCPAYFVATNTEAKELLVCIRGTSEMEDLLVDITAFPVVRRLLRVLLSMQWSAMSRLRSEASSSPVVAVLEPKHSQ